MDNRSRFRYPYMERCGDGEVTHPRTDGRTLKAVGKREAGKSTSRAESRQYSAPLGAS